MIVSFNGKKEPGLKFSDVPENGFFVTNAGNLAQKVNSRQYNVVAGEAGQPVASRWPATNSEMTIERIVPVDRIAF